MFKILIADDEQMIRKSLKRDIDWKKYDSEIVGEAENGTEATELIRSLVPDILIIDLYMPYINGMDVIEWVHKEMPSVQVIILSAYNQFEYAQKAMFYSVSGYLLKPIVQSELDKVMKKVIDAIKNRREIDIPYKSDFESLDFQIVRKVKNYVEQHYCEKITVDTLAKENYVSISHFSKMFREITGQNFVDYLTDIRIKKAKLLLSRSSYQLNEIALMTGYEDYSYFCRVFKKIVGISPLKYRMGKIE